MLTTIFSRLSSYMSAIMVFVLGASIYIFALIVRSRKKRGNILKTVIVEVIKNNGIQSEDVSGKSDGSDSKNKFDIVFVSQEGETIALSIEKSECETLSVGTKGSLTYKGKHFIGFDTEKDDHLQ